MEQHIIEGSKGGSGSSNPRTPVETPNNIISKSYSKVLIAVAEGELAGQPTDQDIYLDGTPLVTSSGVPNFNGVSWEWKSGTTDQSYIKGMPDANNEIGVGVELTSDNPWSTFISKSSLSAIRVNVSWPALLQQITDGDKAGDTIGYTIRYRSEISTDGGPFVTYQNYEVSGKTNSGYSRSHRINLPDGDSWTLRMVRETPNSTSSAIQDTMNITSFTEVVDAKLRYPNTALLYVEFDSELFPGGSIPKISVKTRGRLVRIPTNYNPETREYSGVWDGSFKWAYTNNPAWVFFDLVTQSRFGLGSRVDATQVDKWTMYQLAQYCDVLVDDGAGGMEPRYTCNVYIQSREEAWAVLRDIASVFNGMTFWNGQQIVAKADMPVDINTVHTFSRTNVENGEFTYDATDERSIFTTAIVSFDDPSNHYNTATEAVWDRDLVVRYGAQRPTEISAIGCTSRGEAQRRGKYALITNRYNRIVTFRTGLEGYLPQPGEVIGVASPELAGRPFTGRIISGTTTEVVLDRDGEVQAGDTLFLNTPDYGSVGRTVDSVSLDSQGRQVIQVAGFYPFTPEPYTVWYNEADDLKSQLFRVTKISRPEEGKFQITAVEYNDSKYAAIDNGARLEERPILVAPEGLQPAPENVTISSYTYVEQEMAVTTMTISWQQTRNAVLYEVQWKVDDGDWVNAGTTTSLSVDIKGIYTGDYVARVRAINALDVKSLWAQSAGTTLNGKVGAPPSIPTFTTTSEIFAIRLNWTFPPGATDTSYTEIEEAPNANGSGRVSLTLASYPDKTYLKSGMAAGVVRYFRARLVDKSGNVSPWTDWVFGQSSADADEILDYITGKITETELGSYLQEEIGKVSGVGPGSVSERIESAEGRLESVVDTVESQLQGDISLVDSKLSQAETRLDGAISDTNTRINDAETRLEGEIAEAEGRLEGSIGTIQSNVDSVNLEVTDLNNRVTDLDNSLQSNVSSLNFDIANLESQLTDIVGAEDWSPASSYLQGSLVKFEDSLYRAEQNVPAGTPVSNEDYWIKIGDYASIGEAVAALSVQVSDIQTTVDEVEGVITAQATSLNSLIAVRGKNADGDKADALKGWQTQASITQRDRVEASDKEALAERLLLIDASIGESEAQISSLQQAFASETEATALRLDQLSTEIGDSTANLQQQIEAVSTETSALASDITAIQVELEGVATSEALQTLTSQVDEIDGRVTASSEAITALESRIGAAESNIQGVSTAVSNLETTVSSVDGKVDANSQSLTSLETRVESTESGLSGVSSAVSGLETEVTQIGGNVTTNSQSITSLTGRVNQTEAGISGNSGAISSLNTEVSQLDGRVSANAQSITSLDSRLDEAEEDIQGVATAVDQLEVNVTQLGDDISSNTSSINGLSSRVEQNELGVEGNSESINSLSTDVSVIDGKVTSQAKSLNYLTASARGENADGAKADALKGWLAQASITENRRVSVSEAEASAERDLLLQTEINNTNSALLLEQQTRANADSALSQQALTLQAEVEDNKSLISQVETASVSRDSALASDITAIQTELEGVATSQALQALTSEVQDIDGRVTSTSEDLTLLTSRVDDAESDIQGNSTALSSLSTEVTQIDGELTAQASQVLALQSEVDDNRAAVSYEATTRASEDEALGSRITETEATLGDGIASVNQRVDAYVAGESLVSDGTFTAGDFSQWEAPPDGRAIVIDSLNPGGSGGAVADNSPSRYFAEFADQNHGISRHIHGAWRDVSAGDDYSVKMDYAARAGTDGSIRLTVQWWDSSGSMVSVDTVAIEALTGIAGGAWLTTEPQSVTVPTGAIRARVVVSFLNDSTSGRACFTNVVASRIDAALARRVDELAVEVGDNYAEVTGEIATLVDEQSSLAQSTQQLRTEFDSAEASFDSRITTLSEDQTAISQRTTSLESRVGDTEDNISSVSSRIDTEETTRADADAALTQQYNLLSSKVGDNEAAIQQVDAASVDRDSALTTSVNTLQSEVDGNTASVQQTSSALADLDGDLAAMWSVKTQVNNNGRRVFAGIGLGIENGPGGLESQFLVQADRFAVLNSFDGNLSSPFAIEGGQTFINDALINKLLFTKLRSSDGSLVFQGGKLQASYIAADQLSVDWGQIQNAWVTNAQIATAAIDSAKIRNAAVDTLQIKGQAVTIPTSAYTAGGITLGSEGGSSDVGGYFDYKDIQTLWVPWLPGTTEILCSFRLAFQIADGVGWPQVRLTEWEGSTPVTRYESRVEPGISSFAVVIPPKSGSRTFALQLRLVNSAGTAPGGLQFRANNRFIRTLTLKDNT